MPLCFSDTHSISSGARRLSSLLNPAYIHTHIHTVSLIFNRGILGILQACVSNVLRYLWELGADMWVANGTDASPLRNIQYPPSLTHCILSTKTTTRQILKPDAITESLNPERAENRMTQMDTNNEILVKKEEHDSCAVVTDEAYLDCLVCCLICLFFVKETH